MPIFIFKVFFSATANEVRTKSDRLEEICVIFAMACHPPPPPSSAVAPRRRPRRSAVSVARQAVDVWSADLSPSDNRRSAIADTTGPNNLFFHLMDRLVPPIHDCP